MTDFDYAKLLERAEKFIPKEVKAEARFKLPPPDTLVQGNKTFFVNFKAIADKCERDPKHMLKFMSHELATLGLLEGHQAVFTGKFSFSFIRNKLSAYIKEFVICSECGKPDTKIIKNQRMFFLKCSACGARHSLRSI